MRTAEEQILSEMAKNGIDIKTEDLENFRTADSEKEY
jgi:hypothetical protein